MWFLKADMAERIESLRASGITLDISMLPQDLGKLSVSDKVGVIPIRGVLTEERDIFAAWFGGGNTLYSDIRAAVSEANADSNVDEIHFEIDSPGGSVVGLFETMDAIAASSKPTVARVGSMAASAAYGLASQAGRIDVKSRASMLGSVGVAYDTVVYLNEVSVSSTEAPKKRPDLTTEEGQQVIREHLDDIHALFAEGIAKGRKTTVKKVNSNFGRGGILLAEDALAAGMIDAIIATDKKQTALGGKTAEVRSMDLKTLKAEHPDVYAEAVAEERDRVVAHLTLGMKSGDMKTAADAIETGAKLSEAIQAKYLAANMDRQDRAKREEDNVATNGLAEEKQNEDSMAELVAKAVEKEFAYNV